MRNVFGGAALYEPGAAVYCIHREVNMDFIIVYGHGSTHAITRGEGLKHSFCLTTSVMHRRKERTGFPRIPPGLPAQAVHPGLRR
jgi:hypothetical protein